METKKSRLTGAAKHPNKRSNSTTPNPPGKHRRMAPYGRTLSPDALEVLIRYGWPRYQSPGSSLRPGVLVLPVGENPGGLNWPVDGRDVFFSATLDGPTIPPDVAMAAAEAFWRDGAESICIFGLERDSRGGLGGLILSENLTPKKEVAA